MDTIRENGKIIKQDKEKTENSSNGNGVGINRKRKELVQELQKVTTKQRHLTKTKEKDQDNIIYTPESDSKPDPKGVGHYYYTQLMKHQNEIAQIDGYTKEEDTFGSLLQRSVRTALTMLDKGIKPGDHVSLCTYHHFNSAVPHIASCFTGAIMGAIDPALSLGDCVYLLKQTLPKIIFVNPSSVTLVEKIVESIGTKTEIVVFGKTTQHTPFSKYLRSHKDEKTFKPREVKNLNDIALIVFSSGSTGMPTGVCHSHLSILYYTNERPVRYKQVLYAVLNPYWSLFALFLQLSIEFGNPRIIYPVFDVNDAWTMYYQHVDLAFISSIFILQMIRSKRPEKANLKHVKTLNYGGSSLTLKQLNEIKLALPYTKTNYNYGQSEVFTGIFAFQPTATGMELLNKNPCSVGTVVKGVHYKIVDIETEKNLGPNQIGELRIKTSSQCVGYFKRDPAECFDSDGWLKTGDLFYYNEDLCFYAVDRIKESFKYLNHHISPVEIEKIILDLEPVEAAVIMGKPHETDCNLPMAVVKLK
ncbi:hypothetical protein RN001_014961 [Aquatica leii]|uniref:AMP-dependent synthetase/ligase domain-containing protein n=1 Tax=Aquatica leii TaxID=1421715 RepID=A0AAN7PQ14_9COLE|nr:hypothetical protein RN001_014961 [Aquatica leii]